ncbi:MAG: porin family protein [Dysgonamonadaceae bacterium]|jgi:hypothetical protein|nr:porin family protein [Dysgonamonadaceae bacterium]
MRNIISMLVLALFTGTVSLVKAQDIIILTNGNEIKAKVLEIGTTEVKYKKYGNESGPNYYMGKSKIARIRYETGDEDVFSESDIQTETPVAPVRQTTTQRQETSQPVVTQRQETPVSRQPVVVADYPGIKHKKGYLGFLIGGGTVLEDYSNIDKGVHYSINAGYLFNNNVGVHISLFGSAYSLSNKSNTSYGLRGTFVGPLFSFPTQDYKLYFDLRPSIGLAQGEATIGEESGTTKGSFGVGIGTSLRWNVAESFALSFNLDYINAKAGEIDWPTVGFTLGFNWCF